MGTAESTYRREHLSARGMVLVGAACALALTVLVGVCSAGPGSGGRVGPGSLEGVREARHERSVSSPVQWRHEALVGAHDASPNPGRLENPRLPGKPTPHHQRFDPRNGPAVKPDVRTAALTRTLLSCALPPCQSRIADRPLIANCPARGPPRTA
jgi:hypothetical protein